MTFNSNKILITFLIFLGICSNYKFLSKGEFSLIELSQIIILLVTLIIHLKSKKLFLKQTNLFIYNLRIMIFSILFFEEISFITKNRFNFLNSINSHSEFNIHNLSILSKYLFTVNIPYINYSFSLNYYVFFIITGLFIFSYGFYITRNKEYRFFFLEKDFHIYSFVFLISTTLNSINSKLIGLPVSFLNHEIIELFIYSLLLLDTIKKRINLICNAE